MRRIEKGWLVRRGTAREQEKDEVGYCAGADSVCRIWSF